MRKDRKESPLGLIFGVGLLIACCVVVFIIYKALTTPKPTLNVERGTVAVLFDGPMPVVLDPGTHDIDPERPRPCSATADAASTTRPKALFDSETP